MTPQRRHKYEYEIDPQGESAASRVLQFAGRGTRILELGAGPGSMTRYLSGDLGCDVVALENDTTAIPILQSYARAVHPADLNGADWDRHIAAVEGTFDRVIAADVLEHLYDPWTVLGKMKNLLNDTGSVILSLPHAGHCTVTASLIDEDFEYRDWGLLDRTHIRFFGLKNIQSLHEEQGLAIEEAYFVVRTPEMTEFAHRWSRMPQPLRAMLASNRFGYVYQVVTRAVPRARARRALRLADLKVELPPKEICGWLVNQMACITPGERADLSSTIDEVPQLSLRSKLRWKRERRRLRFPIPREPSAVVPGQALTGHIVSSQSAPQHIVGNTQSEPQHIAGSTRLLAFYLPQFHPIPENDEWWGKGFTEWTNTTEARPLFPGHYQPHLPADLGFYDLRVRQTRHQQIALARQYGIDGFCYHYYWFSGRRVLEQPLNDMLADAESDMPFCICWANENWSRRWDASEHEILLAQQYRADDDLRFITELEPVLKDRRYIHVDGAPLLIVYRPQHLPDPQSSARIWRDYCRSVGIPRIHLCAAFTHGNWDYAQFGFDSGVEFPPHNVQPGLDRDGIRFNDRFTGTIIDYPDIADRYLQRDYSADYRGFRTVFPSWDNTARRGERATAVINSTPQNYEYWLDRAIAKTEREQPDQDRLVFINAWNEWAEGCHLEPDRRYGRLFLEATLRAKRRATAVTGFTHAGVPVEAQRTRRRRRFGSPGKWLGKWLESISWLDQMRQHRQLQVEYQRLIAELDRQRMDNVHVRDVARALAEADRVHRELQQVREGVPSQPVSLVRKVTR